MRGLHGDLREVALRSHDRLRGLIDFSRAVKPQGGGDRSIQPVVYRHGSAGILLRRTYRNCLVFNPFHFSDGKEIVAQQAVMIRHHCSVLNGGTTAFVDVTDPQKEGYRLLDGKDGAEILAAMVQLSKSRFAGEFRPHVYDTWIALKDQLSVLKDRYVESVYLDQALWFLSENLGAERPDPEAETVRGAFRESEREVLETCNAHVLWRENDTPGGLLQKQILLSTVKSQLSKTDALLDAQRSLRKALRARSRLREVKVPGGQMKYGLSQSIHPVHGYMYKRLMPFVKEAGMETCATSVLFYYNDATEGGLAFEKARLAGIEKRCAAVGVEYAPQCFGSLPHSLVAKYKEIENGRTGWDLLKGEPVNSIPWTKKMYVTPVFSAAFRDPEYLPWLERRGRHYGAAKCIKVLSIGGEGLLHERDAYSPSVVRLYQDWLKARHGTIAVLNDRWNTTHGSFEDVDAPRRYPVTQPERANWYGWCNFRAEKVTDYFGTVYKTLKRVAPGKRISSCMNQASAAGGLDYYAFCQHQDVAGFHNTPTNRAWYCPGLAGKGKRGMNTETKSINTSAYPWRGGGERAKQFSIRYDTLRFFASGVTEVHEFTWGGDGLGQRDGFLNLSGAEIKHFNRWKDRWEGVSGGEHARDWAQVGLYWSYASKVQLGFPQKNFYLAYRMMDRWNALLDALHVPFETVPRQKVKAGQIGHLKLIVLPQDTYLERDVAEKLLTYVKQGGSLLLVGESGRYDECGNKLDLFFQQAGVVYIPLEPLPVLIGQRTYPTSALRTDHEAEEELHVIGYSVFIRNEQEALIRYDDETPALVRAPMGKGRVYFLGFPLSDAAEVLKMSFSNDDLVHQVMRLVLGEMEITAPISGEDPNVKINTWKGEDGWHFAIMQNRSAEDKVATFSIPGTVRELVEMNDRVAVKKTESGGRTVFSLPLIKAGARVVAWRK